MGPWLLLVGGLLLLLGAVAVAGVLRYAHLVDDVRGVRATAGRLAVQVRSLGPDELDRGSMEELRGELTSLETRLAPLREVVRSDPLVSLARSLPVVGTQVAAADDLVSAADALLEAGDLGLDLATEVVTLREADAADPSRPLLPELVGLMATSTDDVDRIGTLVEQATLLLDGIPDEAIGPIRDARDLVREPLADHVALLESYRELDDVLPATLGWGDEKRYLVLAQNPAELRPTGGYSGTVGVVVVRDGAVVEQRFQDVAELDRLEGLPFVTPPDALRDHLLGDEQSWRLADANWSPDFPTSARKALEFYELQSGDSDIDGVIAITTFALDRLLEVVGPVAVDEYDVTVQPGNVTMVLLDATRGGPREGRKEVLDALAGRAMVRLMRTPPERWGTMAEALEEIVDRRLVLAWFKDPALQQMAVDLGLAGPVRQDEGDYLYVVEANVAPTSKYNLVIERSSSLVVKLDDGGDAVNSVRLDWQNDAGKSGEPYRSLREFSYNQEGLYGAYVRLLVPRESELVSVSGRASDDIGGAESISEESGRASFANALLIPPGEATMTYLWTTSEAAIPTDDGWEYRLVIQKQPAAAPEPLRVRIDLPKGATVVEASEGATISDDRVAYETTLVRDVEIVVRYELPAPDA